MSKLDTQQIDRLLRGTIKGGMLSSFEPETRHNVGNDALVILNILLRQSTLEGASLASYWHDQGLELSLGSQPVDETSDALHVVDAK